MASVPLLNRWFLTVLALISLTASALVPANAQTAVPSGIVRGKIQNATNGAYLENAIVTISGTNHQAITNSYGEYEFSNVPAGEITLVAKYVGEPDLKAAVTVLGGASVEQDFTFRQSEKTVRTKDGAIVLDPFLVSSERYHNAKAIALAEERNSINIKNVAAIDEFGIMPSNNVGEFVKFLPGVQIDYGASNNNNQGYSEGTANGVSVRGFGTEDTTILVDGLPIASTLPGSLTRQTGLDQLSLNNASRVELIKVATPDMPANSIGGQINLVTRSAFEFAKPSYSARVYFDFNSLNSEFGKTPGPVNKDTRKITPGLDFSVSYPFSKTFGMTFAGNLNTDFNQSYRAQPTWNNTHATNYQNGAFTNAAGAPTSTSNPVLTRYQITDSANITDRRSANIKADWRPTPNQLIRANAQYSTYETSEGQRKLDFRPFIANGIEWDGTKVTGALNNSSVTDMTVTTRDRVGNTISGQMTYELEVAGFKISAAGSYSKSESDFEDAAHGHFSEVALKLNPGRVGLYGLDQGLPSQALTYLRTTNLPVDYTVLSNWVFDNTLAKSGESHNEKIVSLYKIDVERPLDFIPFLKSNTLVFKTGYRKDEETNAKSGRGSNYREILRPGASYTVPDILDEKYVQSPGYGLANQQWASTYKLYEINKANNIFYVPDFDEVNNVRVENYNSFVGQQKSIKETTDAWYAQLLGRFFSNRLSILGGLRQEKKSRVGLSPITHSDWDFIKNADGTLYTDAANLGGVQFSAGNGSVVNGVVITAPTNRPLFATNAAGIALRQALTNAGIAFPTIPVGNTTGASASLSSRMLQYEPNSRVDLHSKGKPSYSLNAAYQVTKKIDFKAAISRSFKLPNLEAGAGSGLLSGATNFSIDEYADNQVAGQQGALGQITVANPNLLPEVSNNLDFELSYHNDSGGKIAVSYYTKKVTNQVMNFSTYSGSAEFNAIVAALGLEAASFEDWRIVTSTNSATKQKTSGWELAVNQDFGFLGKWGKHFQGFVSYSMTDFPTPDNPIPYTLNHPDGTTTTVIPTVLTVTLRANRFGGAGLQFSTNRLSVQLRGTYRNENEQGNNRLALINGNFLRRIEPSETRVDLSASFMLSKRYSLFLSGRDIFNGERALIQRDDLGLLPAYAQIFDRKKFGVSWTVGVNGTF